MDEYGLYTCTPQAVATWHDVMISHDNKLKFSYLGRYIQLQS